MKKSSWYDSIEHMASMGSQSERPGSLAGLHAARENHLSQFFTPTDLSAFVWSLISPAMDAAIDEAKGKRRISILDNSVGSGRLLQFADPDKHHIAGSDVHQASISALNKAADKAGFSFDFINAGMENLNARGFDVALINPPFSLTLSSPNMRKYECCSFGKFGAHTSAVSHFYSLSQALEAASVVAAVFPTSSVQEVIESEQMGKRLAAIYDLPSSAFKAEGIAVRTSVLVFDSYRASVKNRIRVAVKDINGVVTPPPVEIPYSTMWERTTFRAYGWEDDGPIIDREVTGNRSVRVAHDGRKIILKYSCGLTEAMVSNAVLQNTVSEMDGLVRHRYAKGVKYTGQGMLDIEVILLQDNPITAFERLISVIREAGGIPDVDPGLTNYIAKRVRQHELQSVPLRHTVFTQSGSAASDADVITATARKAHIAGDGSWGNPLVKEGQKVEFTKTNGVYSYSVDGKEFTIQPTDIPNSFNIIKGGAESSGWNVIHEGRVKSFPEHAKCLTAKAKALGIDKILSWHDYQFYDLIESCMDPDGCICGWKMGLGKARLAISLCLMGGKTNLICIEPQLVEEMQTEIEALGLPKDTWKIIKNADDVQSLRKINIISYTRLRMPVKGKGGRVTIARMLRRRISTLVADEGHLLRNTRTQQSRALQSISAKKKYLLSGTPINNYPRDVATLLAFVFGDGTAIQPYGQHRSYMEQRLFTSMSYAGRGIDVFRDHFITTQWSTNEFNEDNASGAKREIPKIKDVERFRSYLAPLVKRRLTQEPDVRKYISIPEPSFEPVQYSEWDEHHLAHYITVADEFVNWYRAEKEVAGARGKSLSLIAILERIQAVQTAANYPQKNKGRALYSGGLTSKQRACLEQLRDLVKSGHKTIFYATSPDVLDLFYCELSKIGIKATLFHGGIDIMSRTRDLDRDFRNGDSQILLASYGVTQKGLNIWQADRVIQYNRDWTSTTEDQAIARVLRPQQQKKVKVFKHHLQGSIDEYQAQLVTYKRESACAGLDYGEQTTGENEFLHMDTIIGRFCENLAELRGCTREELKLAA